MTKKAAKKESSERARLLASVARVPPHVVYRAFVNETVVLNLQTGQYHGLNPSGAHMLEALDGAPTVGEAAARLAEEYGQPVAQIEDDVCSFCLDLRERGLVETVSQDHH